MTKVEAKPLSTELKENTTKEISSSDLRLPVASESRPIR